MDAAASLCRETASASVYAFCTAPSLSECLIFPLQVTTAVVVVVIDLSDPASVLSTTQYWIDQVRLY